MNKDQPAFPAMDMTSHMGVATMELRYTGLTKREYFAAKAMQGLLASMTVKASIGNWMSESEEIAKFSVTLADDLLKALEP